MSLDKSFEREYYKALSVPLYHPLQIILFSVNEMKKLDLTNFD